MGSVELAILKEAQAGGYLEEIPDDEAKIAEEAIYYVRQAEEAITDPKFKKDKTVKAIIALSKSLSQDKAAEEGKDIFGAPLTTTYRGLPVPSDPEGDPTAMPIDFTELTQKEIMRLHAVYNGYTARARWMLAIATNKLASATHLRDAEYRRSYAEVFNAQGEKKLTQPQLEINAKGDKKYLEIDNTVKTYQEDVVSLKALVEIYAGNVERLSREWTMRQDDDKRNY